MHAATSASMSHSRALSTAVYLLVCSWTPACGTSTPLAADRENGTVSPLCSMVVTVAVDATESERGAAAELAALAGDLCGGPALKITAPVDATGESQLAVGAGAAMAIGIAPADLKFSVLGKDGFVASSNRSAALRATDSYALSGAADMPALEILSSGTLYACYHLLRALGVRFLAWDYTHLPAQLPSPLTAMDVSYTPVFEYRDVDGWAALSHPQQAKYFHMNGAAQAKARAQLSSLPATTTTMGSVVDSTWRADSSAPPTWLASSPYAYPPGFVHTSYNLFQGDTNGTRNCTTGFCPPLDMFEKHNEWFYPHDDSSVYGQLCWTNQSLIKHVADKAKLFLSTQPNARIISISQNDNGRYCTDPAELAVIQEEGSPMGPLLRAVNQVARALAPEYPSVAVDTLAYQYSQSPPTITKPEPNVITRLCDISSNAGAPLTDPTNAEFVHVIDGWNAITKRIYTWNYVVDFGSMLQTFPNYYVLGPNIKFFVEHGVKGVFEEGPGIHTGDGTDMEELKDYVMAEMLWDPSLDPDVLITEFLDGYYGGAAPFVRLYMDTMHAAVNETKHFLKACCVQPPEGIHKSYLTDMALLISATAFKHALDALAPSDSVRRERVERASMAITYVCLWRWADLKDFAANRSYTWPLDEDKEAAFTSFARIYNRTGTNRLTTGTQNRGGAALNWLHNEVFAPPGPPPGPDPTQGLYAEIVLDECSNATGTCNRAGLWTTIRTSRPYGTLFKSALSSAGNSCYAMNVPGSPVEGHQVLAYGDATRKCDSDAVQNTFVNVSSGLLATSRGYTTSTCVAVYCCVTAVPNSDSVVMAACDGANPLQQFEVEKLSGGAPGHIRHKTSGRCLSTKHCATPHADDGDA